MKMMNKVIAAMMMMAITSAMPAMAGNKKHNNGKNNKVVVVVDKKTTHFNAHKHLRCESDISPSYHAFSGINVCHTIYIQEVPACKLCRSGL